MALETPAKIAIIGAGPIGLESALYARYLGYDVVVLERGRLGENIRHWGHVQLFTPFGMNRSPLGLAALAAQDETYQPPDDDTLLTGTEFVERYLVPLAQTDLLSDAVKERAAVIAIGREGIRKTDQPGPHRSETDFRILWRDENGTEQTITAEAVIDTTGVFDTPNWLGSGGIPAVGEIACRHRIEYGIPDLSGAAADHYRGKQIAIVGAGHLCSDYGRGSRRSASTRPHHTCYLGRAP